ncbi:imidazolonepropionase [Hornefia butyriciproducens]|uniref:imidazolonepropionase n=1 Tax=Hornefia butyriciproducens TaxID=2652293 RepID=UPI002A9194F6|nr:imidazolonepropionase [Hornefia butyriciproducens]MCI7414084.1 imidazolonepropionase [Clostridiales bacterium]MDY6211786.1 imidazolonepropionase [Hornefia butyriciproducens]
MSTLLIKNIGTLQTPVGSYSHRGAEQGENRKLRDAAVYIRDSVITEITDGGDLPLGAESADVVLDANYRLVTPGLVDGHTHMVFGGYRQHEVAMKLKGATYLDILRAGGGILDTVRKTREADEADLCYKTGKFLDEMMNHGVTTCEAKSGYGLDFNSEMKMLEVIGRLNESHAMDVVPTFMGPHAIPEEYKGRPDDFIDMICGEMLPYVKEHKLAEFADIFCEDSVFNYEQSRKYLLRAKELGFGLRIHADEIEAIGGSRLAGELGCVSAEHLISIDEDGLESMAKGGTTAMCLPATSFYLGANYAPARRMIEMGIPVACASDFNPGSCPSMNLQFVMNLACLKYRLLPEEVLTAVTINPACAIGRGDRVGTLEVGKQADLVIWDAPDMEMLCYRFGSNMTARVVKKGKIIK